MNVPRFADVEVGTTLPDRQVHIRRADLVRYAGASGDFNPIHWSQRVATEVGLPDVIAHGMFTMAQGASLVAEWVGDPGRVVEYAVRFATPVVVPDDADGASLELSARVGAVLDDQRVRIDITARSAGAKVLSLARAVVRLD